MTENVAPEVPCARIHEGDVLEPVQIPVTRETLVRYAGASTDFNPIHWSDRAARAAGMDGVIAHGMWTAAAALAPEGLGRGGRSPGALLGANEQRPRPAPRAP